MADPELAAAASAGGQKGPNDYDPTYMKDEHLDLVAQLRERVQDVMQAPLDTDIMLYKYLKARDFKIDVAEALYRKSIDFRNREGVDAILHTYEPPLVCRQHLCSGYHGVSKSGHLVWYDRIALMDPKGLVKSCRPEDYRRNFIWDTENMRRIMATRVKETGQPCHQNVQVFDLYGLGMNHLYKPAIDIFSAAIGDMEGFYPEGLFRLFIVRAPSTVSLAYNMVKGLLPTETQKKIVFVGKDYLAELQNYIDIDQIPDFLGGKCTRCKENNGQGCGIRPLTANPEGLYEGIRSGGEIPKSLYGDADIDSWDMVKIKSGKGESVRIVCDDPRMLITLEYTSKDTVLDVTWYYQAKDDPSVDVMSMKVVRPLKKSSTAFIPTIETFEATDAGCYVIMFQNANSWSECKLHYRVQVASEPKGSRLQRTSTVAEVTTVATDEVGMVDTTQVELDTISVHELEADRISQMSRMPALNEEVVVMEGELYAKIKTAGAVSHSRKWVQRHHVLTESGKMYTYLAPNDTEPTGVHKLKGLIVAEIGMAASKFAPVGIHGKMYMFELQDPNTGATLQLSAEIEKDGHEWVQQLRRAAGTEGQQGQARRSVLGLKTRRGHKSSDSISVAGYAGEGKIGAERSPSLRRKNRDGSASMDSSPGSPVVKPRVLPTLEITSSDENLIVSKQPARTAAAMATVSPPSEPTFVVSQLTQPYDDLAQKYGFDDAKDVVIVILLTLLAIQLAYVKLAL